MKKHESIKYREFTIEYYGGSLYLYWYGINSRWAAWYKGTLAEVKSVVDKKSLKFLK